MIRAAVVGATGYAGAELVRLLRGHSRIELTVLASKQFAGQPFSAVYPGLGSHIDLTCEPLSADELSRRADVVFTALPHKIPMSIVPNLIAAGCKVVDLSADFRFKNAETYAAHYQPHSAPELLTDAVYGLSEVYRVEIGQADLIGNPGCYPTSTLLPLIPLLREGLIKSEDIIVDSKSGVSGAGRGLSLTTHFCQVNESLKAYKVAAHRHTPEIEAALSDEAGQSVAIVFTPHLVPMTRGMLTTIYVRPQGAVAESGIRSCLTEFYANSPFVRICEPELVPDTLQVRGTNRCDIGLKHDPHTGRLILISAIDNLVKGAAGQAVQNMNLMFGFDEQEGLDLVPFPL